MYEFCDESPRWTCGKVQKMDMEKSPYKSDHEIAPNI